MRRLHSRLITFSLCAFVFLSPSFLSAAEQRVALVIGNSNYMTAPLKNPVNDATDIASALKKLGFKVTLKTNADLRAMKRAIRDLGKELKKGGVGLFYYSGHGVQVKGRNYLIPIHATIESEGDVEFEAIDAGLVLAKMEDAGNSLNINILDACRDNPFTRSFRSMTKGLAIMEAPQGSILSFSTAPGDVASDGSGRNGLYTSMLLKHMTTPGLEIGRIFRKVRTDVMQTSNNKQIPWELSSLTGDFYFIPDNAQPKMRAQKPEEEAWKIVNELSTADGYAMFLKKYPHSEYRSIAAQKIEKLREKTGKVAEKKAINAEAEAWEIVKQTDSVEHYTMFLDQYPNGEFSPAAKLKILQLKERYRIALLPVKLISDFSIYHDFYIDSVVTTTASVIDNDARLKFELTYRDVKGLSENVKILSANYDEIRDQIWEKESFFSDFRPSMGKIQNLSAEYGADITILVSLRMLSGDNMADIFLYDLKQNKMYSKLDLAVHWDNVSRGVQQGIELLVKEFYNHQ